MVKSKRSKPRRDIAPVIPIPPQSTSAPPCTGQRSLRLAIRNGTFTGDLHRLADWFKSCGDGRHGIHL
jgi:hypothetical protein